jgi:hypothetical protein
MIEEIRRRSGGDQEEIRRRSGGDQEEIRIHFVANHRVISV